MAMTSWNNRVWRLDRWGRSLVDLVTTLQELMALGVRFVSLSDALEMTTPSGRALAGVGERPKEFERLGEMSDGFAVAAARSHRPAGMNGFGGIQYSFNAAVPRVRAHVGLQVPLEQVQQQDLHATVQLFAPGRAARARVSRRRHGGTPRRPDPALRRPRPSRVRSRPRPNLGNRAVDVFPAVNRLSIEQ